MVEKEESALHLMHSTPQEYLKSRQEMFRKSYAVKAQIRSAYNPSLHQGTFSTSDDAPQNIPRLIGLPLTTGATMREMKPPGEVKSLAPEPLGGFGSHISSRFLLSDAAKVMPAEGCKGCLGYTA